MADNKQNKRPNVPLLRFPEFTDEWKRCKVGDDCDIYMCKRIFADQTNDSIGVPFYKIGTIGGEPDAYISRDLFKLYKKKYNYPQKGEVMITCAGTVGKAIVFDGKDSYFQDSNIVWISNTTSYLSNDYLYYFINRVDWSKLNSTTITRIYNDDLRKLNIAFPSIDEQKKIVQLLYSLDRRIAVQNKIIEDLQQLKSALVERLYCQHNPNFKIGDLVVQVSKRNRGDNDYSVLSVNNRLGFIEQSEQFEDRSVASEDTSNYKVVSRDDFAYNPARINVGSIARLTSFESGIVSPMYISFHTKKQILPQYLEHFFDTSYFYYEMQKRLEGSVRLCLSWEGLCNIPIAVPPIERQEKVSKRISRLADKISLEELHLDLLKSQKRYLLQTMFI